MMWPRFVAMNREVEDVATAVGACDGVVMRRDRVEASVEPKKV